MRKIIGLLFGGMILSAGIPSQAADVDTLRQIYTLVPENSFNEVSLENLSTSLLEGINGVDKKLMVGNGADDLSLYYNGRLLKVFYKPQNRRDIEGWVKVSTDLLDLATEHSPKAAKHDFELVDLAMAEAVKHLDKGTKFYLSQDAMKNKRGKHKRFFAARQEGNILYIRLAVIGPAMVEEVKDAVKRYSDASGVILDLRGNPGGSFDSAIKIVDLFLDGAIIASTKGRKNEDSVYYNAGAGDILNGKPIVVLADGETASAAEVIAAALQEQGRAKIIGTGTFGKASVQQLLPLPSGAVLAVTRAFYYTPSGFLIEGRGIIPDICTFEIPDSKNIRKLLAAGAAEKCPSEARAANSLDFDAAKELLEGQIRQKM